MIRLDKIQQNYDASQLIYFTLFSDFQKNLFVNGRCLKIGELALTIAKHAVENAHVNYHPLDVLDLQLR